MKDLFLQKKGEISLACECAKEVKKLDFCIRVSQTLTAEEEVGVWIGAAPKEPPLRVCAI